MLFKQQIKCKLNSVLFWTVPLYDIMVVNLNCFSAGHTLRGEKNWAKFSSWI